MSKKIKVCNYCRYAFNDKIEIEYNYCPYCGRKLEYDIHNEILPEVKRNERNLKETIRILNIQLDDLRYKLEKEKEFSLKMFSENYLLKEKLKKLKENEVNRKD